MHGMLVLLWFTSEIGITVRLKNNGIGPLSQSEAEVSGAFQVSKDVFDGPYVCHVWIL